MLVDATIRRARQLLRTDPDTAYQDLKRQRDEIAGYDGIGNAARTQMVADLEAVMREIFLKGAEIKRQAEAEREAIAKTRQRLNEFDRHAGRRGAATKNRIDQFRQLMQQARFELAYQEAQLMIQERIAKGQTVPADGRRQLHHRPAGHAAARVAGTGPHPRGPLPAHHDADREVAHPVPRRAAGPLPAGRGVARTDLAAPRGVPELEPRAEPAAVPDRPQEQDRERRGH